MAKLYLKLQELGYLYSPTCCGYGVHFTKKGKLATLVLTFTDNNEIVPILKNKYIANCSVKLNKCSIEQLEVLEQLI